VPKTTIAPDYITNCLNQSVDPFPKSRAKMIWVGNLPILAFPDKKTALLTIHQKTAIIEVALPKQMGIWLTEWLKTLSKGTHSFEAFQQDFESHFDDFQSFWLSEEIMDLRENGLLII
jgi:hypothetical protein